MLILAKLVGSIIVLAGIIMVLNPSIAKKMTAYFLEGNRVYIAGLLRMLFGIILMLAAPKSKQMLVVYFLGVIIGLAGAMIFIIKLDKLKAILKKIHEKPASFVRMMALLACAIGALILYSV